RRFNLASYLQARLVCVDDSGHGTNADRSHLGCWLPVHCGGEKKSTDSSRVFVLPFALHGGPNRKSRFRSFAWWQRGRGDGDVYGFSRFYDDVGTAFTNGSFEYADVVFHSHEQGN